MRKLEGARCMARKLAVTLLTMWKTNTMFEHRSFAGYTDKHKQRMPGTFQVWPKSSRDSLCCTNHDKR